MKKVRIILMAAAILSTPLAFAGGKNQGPVQNGAIHHNGKTDVKIGIENNNAVTNTVEVENNLDVTVSPEIEIDLPLTYNNPVTVNDGDNTNTNSANIEAGAIQLDGSNAYSTSNASIEDGAISVTSGDSTAVIEDGAVENTNTLIGGDNISTTNVNTAETVGDVTSDSSSESTADNELNDVGNSESRSSVTINEVRQYQLTHYTPAVLQPPILPAGEVPNVSTFGRRIGQIIAQKFWSPDVLDDGHRLGPYKQERELEVSIVPFIEGFTENVQFTWIPDPDCVKPGYWKKDWCMEKERKVKRYRELADVTLAPHVPDDPERRYKLTAAVTLKCKECFDTFDVVQRGMREFKLRVPDENRLYHMVIPLDYYVAAFGTESDGSTFGLNLAKATLNSMTSGAAGFNGSDATSNAILSETGLTVYVFAQDPSGTQIDMSTLFLTQRQINELEEKKEAVLAEKSVATVAEPQELDINVNITTAALPAQKEAQPQDKATQTKKWRPNRESVVVFVKKDDCDTVCPQ